MRKLFILFIAYFLYLSHIYACLWDMDTLAVERQEFPGALELITGKFPYLTEEFYRWRINDRLAKLKINPQNLEWHDDLAVAYDKIGEHQKAIEIIKKKDAISPGLYETHANLGTFLIHSGQLEQGLVHIKKAIEINPNAHFGREVYQMHLVNAILFLKGDGEISLPLRNHEYFTEYPRSLILDEIDFKPNEIDEVVAKARKGVLGMMRFGDYKHPILLEALAELSDSRIRARAYLKASYEVKKPEASKIYRELAQKSIGMQTRHPNTHDVLSLEELEKSFKEELQQVKEWRKEVDQELKKYISANKELDDVFWDKFSSVAVETPTVFYFPLTDKPLLLIIIIVLFLYLVYKVIIYRKQEAKSIS